MVQHATKEALDGSRALPSPPRPDGPRPNAAGSAPQGASATGQLLSGWGRTAPSWSTVLRPTEPRAVAALLAEASGDASAGVVPRGLGRSYGDAAQRAGGTVIDTSGLTGFELVDPSAGLVRAGGGASLQELFTELVPEGWFPPVTPGTRQVTVGGAFAADVHGKNHHRDGSFGEHVTEIELATPTGLHRVNPAADPALFWATAGGMGLTGVVTSLTLRMLRVHSAWMAVDTERAEDLDDLMTRLEEGDDRYRYSVAWVDCLARGKRLGRGVLTRGDHAPPELLPARHRQAPFSVSTETKLRVPLTAPRGLLNPLSVAAFNEAWFRRAPRFERGRPEPYPAFFHPLDGVAEWNRLYGPSGFVQYQFVVGPDRADVVRSAIERLAAGRVASFLAVLKRFGPASQGPLSFPQPGWTLALDMPVGPPDLDRLLDDLDQIVADACGRVYLAKDARLRPELLAAMYPRASELNEARRRVDPEGVLCSDLAARLGLASRRRLPSRGGVGA